MRRNVLMHEINTLVVGRAQAINAEQQSAVQAVVGSLK